MQSTPQERVGHWHRDWFDRDYLRLYSHRDAEEAAGCLSWLQAEHGLLPRRADGSWTRVLDAGCGAGRHSLLLARRGFRVLGLDWSPELLAEARRGARRWNPDPAPQFVRGDLGRPPLRAGFDWVLSLFTSFGYSEDDRTNERVLSGLQRLVAPGGRLLVDFLNPLALRAELVPESRRQVDGLDVLEKRRIDEGSGMVVKEIEFGEPGLPRRRVVERVKLYEPDWFLRRSEGFGLLAHAGTLEGAPWTPRSGRSLLLLERRTA